MFAANPDGALRFPPADADPATLVPILMDAVAEASGAMVLVVRDDGVIVYANEATLSAFRRGADEIVGRQAGDVLNPEIALERVEHYAQVARQQRSIALEGFVGGVFMRCSLLAIPPSRQGGHAHTFCVSRPIAPDALPTRLPRVRTKRDDLGPLAALSEREIDVLKLIGRGLTTAQIARELHRSVKTIEWHRVSLGAKLGVSNRVDLARLAIRFGLATSTLEVPPVPVGALETDAPK